MDTEHDVLDLFTRQPFFQLLVKLDSERKEPTADRCSGGDELALFLQNTSFSLQSGGWDTGKILELTESVNHALRSVPAPERASLAQSMLLCILHVIKASNAKMSAKTRETFLGCLKSFANRDPSHAQPAPTVAIVAPAALRKVVLQQSDDECVYGWVDDSAQDPWAAECVVHVLLRDAVALGRGSVLTHDGIFVALSLPKTQISDAELFVY